MNYNARLHNLQGLLSAHHCDALIIEDCTNLFYLTGLELSSGALLVHANGADLFVDGKYLESCKKNSPFPVQLLVPAGIQTILNNSSKQNIRKLAFDSATTSHKNYETLKAASNCELVPWDSPLQQLRAIKDGDELGILRQAGILGSQGFDFVCTLLKEGISEKECAIELEIFWKRRGSKCLAFEPIIAFGPNSSMPHHRAGNDRLKSGDIVLIDIGVNLRHYHSDMTRIVFFKQPDTRLLTIHSIVQQAQLAALKLCRPGTLIGELDVVARNHITSQGYGPQFTHRLGHGVGLDIHEFPSIRNEAPFATIPLAPGMVITIEPGIYLPDIGGVRIEDTIVITNDGFENLTNRKTDPIFLGGSDD